MREGDLPSRDGSVTNVDYNHESKMVVIEVNGEREELSVIDTVALLVKVASMLEVVLRNE